MDIITKAKELGDLIASSREMNVLRQCELRVMQDKKADRLLREQKMIQDELLKASKRGDRSETYEQLKKILASKQEEIRNYSVTADFLKAKSDFDNLMKTINDVIFFTITGEEPCSAGKCSSCGGCDGKEQD